MLTCGTTRTVGHGHTMTRGQTVKAPSLHTTLEALSDAATELMRVASKAIHARICDDVDELPRNKVDSRKCCAYASFFFLKKNIKGTMQTYRRGHVRRG